MPALWAGTPITACHHVAGIHASSICSPVLEAHIIWLPAHSRKV